MLTGFLGCHKLQPPHLWSSLSPPRPSCPKCFAKEASTLPQSLLPQEEEKHHAQPILLAPR